MDVDRSAITIENRTRRNEIRLLCVVGVPVAGLLLITALLTGERWLATDILGLVLVTLILTQGFRVLGLPQAQRFMVIRRDGVAYGSRQFVPWPLIDRVEWPVVPFDVADSS